MNATSLGRRGIVCSVAAAMLALSQPSAAWAACKIGDLVGKYELHVFASTTDGDTTWTRCAMTLKPGKAVATVKSGTSCSNDRGGKGQITGGKLKLRKNCSVTGTIGIDSNEVELDHGIMNRDKNAFTGLGHADGDLLLQVTATKR